MLYRDDELRRDINEIKSDVAFLKAKFVILVETLKVNITNIQELAVKSTSKNTEVDINLVQSPLLVEDGLDEIVSDKKYEEENELESETSMYVESKEQSIKVETLTRTNQVNTYYLINSSDIKIDKLKKIVVSYDEKLYNCKNKKMFIEFCHFTIGLVEEACRIFLRKKFQELQDEKNQDLLEACSLLDNNYLERGWTIPSIYVSRDKVLKSRQQVGDDDDNYYLDAAQGKHLSLIELEKGKIRFTLELCFVILCKAKFYQQKSTLKIYDYEKQEKNRKQHSHKAIQRKPPKSITGYDSLKIEYYYRLDNAREFRNIFAHNQSDKTTQEEKINKLKSYTEVDLDNYDGILEATQWLILQIDSSLN